MILTKKNIVTILIVFSAIFNFQAQIIRGPNGKITINGRVYSTKVINGDTVILADLDTVSLSSPRYFKTAADKKLYKKYKYYSTLIYPYAKDAINIFNKLEERTKYMSPTKKRKYIKLTYRQFEHNFKKQLKKLSRTQGKLLIKMIEKETGMTFFNLVKKMRNGVVAFYWHQFGKLYGYNLKEGYVVGADPIMDTVFQDFKFNKKDNTYLNSQPVKVELKK